MMVSHTTHVHVILLCAVKCLTRGNPNLGLRLALAGRDSCTPALAPAPAPTPTPPSVAAPPRLTTFPSPRASLPILFHCLLLPIIVRARSITLLEGGCEIGSILVANGTIQVLAKFPELPEIGREHHYLQRVSRQFGVEGGVGWDGGYGCIYLESDLRQEDDNSKIIFIIVFELLL